MGPLDAYIVYKFIRLLTTPWDEQDAFKLGVIDARGELLLDTDKLKDKQKLAYTLFHRLVFNIKRMIEKVPGGKSKIGTYAAALFLLKEELGDSEGVIVMERTFMNYLQDQGALESTFLEEQFLPEEMLSKGHYKLLNTMLDTKGNHVQKGTVIVAKQNLKPAGRVLGVDVFEVQIAQTGKIVVVSHEDIQEV